MIFALTIFSTSYHKELTGSVRGAGRKKCHCLSKKKGNRNEVISARFPSKIVRQKNDFAPILSGSWIRVIRCLSLATRQMSVLLNELSDVEGKVCQKCRIPWVLVSCSCNSIAFWLENQRQTNYDTANASSDQPSKAETKHPKSHIHWNHPHSTQFIE